MLGETGLFTTYIKNPSALNLCKWTHKFRLKNPIWSMRFPFPARPEIYSEEPGATTTSSVRNGMK